MKIPEYRTIEDCMVFVDGKESKKLLKGSFVKPIEFCYIPQHIKDRPGVKRYNTQTDVYCYTQFGLVSVPRVNLRSY